MQKLPEAGQRYRHYKRGGEYLIIGIARHSESEEGMVIYQAEYADAEFPLGQLWARPLGMFLEEVEYEGAMVPRFQRLS